MIEMSTATARSLPRKMRLMRYEYIHKSFCYIGYIGGLSTVLRLSPQEPIVRYLQGGNGSTFTYM